MKKEMNPKRKRRFFAALILCLTLCTVPALAADDPLTIVNNLSDFIFSCIKAVGVIILGWGIVQVGMSVQSIPTRKLSEVSLLSGMTQKIACLRSPSCPSSSVSWLVMRWTSGKVKAESRTAALTRMLIAVLPGASLKMEYCLTAI